MTEEWAALYKFGRLAFLGTTLLGIAIYLYSGDRRARLEAPARRMLEEGRRMNTPESEARGEVAEYPLPEDLERDGIGEDDHAIPAWFNVGFYGGLVFGVAYILYYSLSSWTSLGEYEAEVARAEALAKANAPAVATANPFLEDATALAEGKQVFTTVCAACHKPDGSGLVGPSLVDPYWKYGDSDTEKYVSVAEGRPLGMPAWLSQLGSEKIWKAIAYADSLPRTDAPGVGAPDYVPPTPGGS